VILIIALHHLFGPLLHRWRPKWTLPFVSEDEQQEELPQEGPKHRPLHWTITLFGFTAVGFFAEAWNCLYSRVNVFEIIYVVSWVGKAYIVLNITDSILGYSSRIDRREKTEIMFNSSAGLLHSNSGC
jgi:hypothetical protein